MFVVDKNVICERCLENIEATPLNYWSQMFFSCRCFKFYCDGKNIKASNDKSDGYMVVGIVKLTAKSGPVIEAYFASKRELGIVASLNFDLCFHLLS